MTPTRGDDVRFTHPITKISMLCKVIDYCQATDAVLIVVEAERAVWKRMADVQLIPREE